MSIKGIRDFRPEYHVTPEKMWMNDPNGMFYRDGVWHLCYQYYPEATHWGPMHWGHVVSRDLVNWEYLPLALKPDELGMIFSGSAVVDTENRSGFGQNGRAPIVAMYTSHGEWEQQSIAYSLDGIHFEPYTKNPVIANQEKKDFRDPKLFWNEVRNCFGVVLAAGDHMEFYASQNLIEWEKTGEFACPGEWCQDAVWECPDLFPMSVTMAGRDAVKQAAFRETSCKQKWVLFVSTGAIPKKRGSCTWYFVGEFDGNHFTAETKARLLDFGYDNYAGVTWSGSKERVSIGWASNWLYANQLPTGEFCGQMTYARRLELRGKTAEGVDEETFCQRENVLTDWYLVQQPMTATENMPHSQEILLEGGERELTSEVVHVSVKSLQRGECVHLKNSAGQVLEIGSNGQSAIYVDRRKVLPELSQAADQEQEREVFCHTFCSEKYGMAVVRQEEAAEKDTWQEHDLEIYWDHSILEVYVDGGEAVLTMLVYPDEPFDRVELIGRKQPEKTGQDREEDEKENKEKNVNRRVKLVVFDMDGLMFDTENLFFHYYQEASRELGYEVTREFYLKTVGANAAAVKQITEELMGKEFPREKASRRAFERIDQLLEEQRIPVKKGLYSLLEYLKENGILCAIASSSGEETIRKYLKSAEIEGYFTCLVNGNEVARSKPEPDIFLKACELCGISPGEAIIMEDSQNGILAGWRAGIPVICVPDMKEPEPYYAERTRLICRDLDEVLELCRERGYL